MNNLLNLVSNKKLTDFKDRIKSACDTKYAEARSELKKTVGEKFSSTDKK